MATVAFATPAAAEDAFVALALMAPVPFSMLKANGAVFVALGSMATVLLAMPAAAEDAFVALASMAPVPFSMLKADGAAFVTFDSMATVAFATPAVAEDACAFVAFPDSMWVEFEMLTAADAPFVSLLAPINSDAFACFEFSLMARVWFEVLFVAEAVDVAFWALTSRD